MHLFYKFSFPVNKNKLIEESSFNHELQKVSAIVSHRGIGEHYIFPDEKASEGTHCFSVYGYKMSDDVSQSERNFDVLLHSGVMTISKLSSLIGVSGDEALNAQLLSGVISEEKALLLNQLYMSYCLGVADKMNTKEIRALIEKDLSRLELNK